MTEKFAAQNLERKAFTVTELNRRAKSVLEGQFSGLWLEGEISNFKYHSSGHMYLTLKDDQSQISAVFFSRYNQSLKFEPKDGLKVLVCGKISLYEQRGQYQFYIERMEPKGLGALQLAFLQLKEKLEKEGLFRAERKKALPKFPSVVGIITSPTGAAIRDILNVIRRRFDGTGVLLYPVKVQGDGAAQEVADAIHDMNRLEDVDVMIVGRGGGSIEDLWAFNEEVVARAVYESRIPIISAVGHEIDWTICDFVADLRAPTPSAAAELVVQNRMDLEKCIHELKVRMNLAMVNLVEMKRQCLDSLQSSFAFRQPMILIDQFSQRLDELSRQMQNYLKAQYNEKKQQFHALAGKLHVLSPLAILERGYAVSFDTKNRILKDATSVKVGDAMHTRLWRGIIHSRVEKITEKE